jgi:YVTN family beta-propeller protein
LNKIYFAVFTLLAVLIAANMPGCENQTAPPPTTVRFSEDILPVFLQNCAVQGCHAHAYENSDGLVLSSWNSIMLNGYRVGAAIVPYNAFWSNIMTHINLDTSLSLVAEPHMPKYRPGVNQGNLLPLSTVSLIAQWINEGAKNDFGNVAFEDATRKAFMTNQASDFVAVVNLDNNFLIRLLPVGRGGNQLSSPHNVEVDKQGKYFYVTLILDGYVEKFDAHDYRKLGRVYIGSSPGHVVITADGSKGYVTNYDLNGTEKFIKSFNTAAMTVIDTISDITFNAAHGEKLTHDGNFLVTVSQNAEYVQIIRTSDDQIEETIPVAENVPPNGNGTGQYQPIAVSISPDDKYAFITCFHSGEVRVLNLNTRTFVAVITVGSQPIQSDCSPDGRWCYVANRGSNSASVINIHTLTVEKTIDDIGIQPHGVCFTPDGRYVYITNESQQPGNPFVHHPITGNTRPGTTAVIDVLAGHVKIKDIEMGSYPTGVSIYE